MGLTMSCKTAVEKANYQREYYKKNVEARAVYSKEYYKKNAEAIIVKSIKRQNDNQRSIAAYGKGYRERHREKLKQYRMENRNRMAKTSLDWRHRNKSKIREYQRRYNDDLNHHLAANLRVRLNKIVRGKCKSGSAVRDLGCSIEEFKIYIESLFAEGMSWENYGNKKINGKIVFGWHLDHIIPLVSFNLADREQFLIACHFTNMQPLWASENLRKGGKIIF